MAIETIKPWLIWFKTRNLSRGAQVIKYNYSSTILIDMDKVVSAFSAITSETKKKGGGGGGEEIFTVKILNSYHGIISASQVSQPFF